MAVTVTTPISGPYIPNGVTKIFAFDFKAGSADEVAVYRVLDGVSTRVLDGDFTATVDADSEGGIVEFSVAPPALGGDLYIASEPNFTREGQYTGEGPFTPKGLNNQFDKAAIRDIYLKDQVERTPRIPIGGATGKYPIVLGDGTWGFSVGSGGGGAATNVRVSITAEFDGQTEFDFSTVLSAAARAAMNAAGTVPWFSAQGVPLEAGEDYTWSPSTWVLTIPGSAKAGEIIGLTNGVSYDQGLVDVRNVVGLADEGSADRIGSKYPITTAAARPIGDRLSDRMPSIWDFYRPDLGDTLSNWSPQLNRAALTDHDIYIPTARRPQGYDLLSPVTQNAGGQMYYGDPTGTGPGSGTEFNIPATFQLGGNGVIIVPPNTAERGCGLADIGFRFFQPDTAVRANLIQYPPALYARNVARMQLKGRVTVYLGWEGFDLQGNNGGLDIDTLRMGCFSRGLIMDGAFDKTNVNTIELWPYGCGAVTESQALYSIYSDGVAIGLELGRVDGFSAKTIKTFRQRIITRNATFDQPGTDGFGTIGELHLDGTYGRLEMGGGKLAVGSWYATTGAGDDFFVKQTGGTLALGACAFALGPGTDTGQALFQVEDGNFSYVGGGIFEAVARQGELFKQTGGDALWFGGNIRSGLNQVRTKAFFEVHGGRCTLKNPRFIDPGTGSGLCVKVTNDEWHDIEINATLTRGFEIPAAGGSGTYKFGSTVQAPVL